MKKITFMIITLALIIFSGCNTTTQGNNSSVGLANPASVYCTEQGGELELNGSIGICKFEKFECEEWAFYRGECPVKESELGEFCGGIGAIECSEGFKCELDGDFPDAGGQCVPNDKITSFEECVAAGNPTTKSIPAQCSANNRTYYEEIEDVKICTMEYMPVCGIDGKTYSNLCMAGNVSIAHQGECN